MKAWHVISDDVGTILDVYAEGRLAAAQESARRIKALRGIHTYLHTVCGTGTAPAVGQSISMRNTVPMRE